MRWRCRPAGVLVLGVCGVAALSWAAGCTFSTGAGELLGLPFFRTQAERAGQQQQQTGQGTTGRSGFFNGPGAAGADPCSEPLARKFVRISMRSLVRDDFVHYFLVLVAFVRSEAHPDGAVCPDDIQLYTQFGYVEIAEGREQAFGNLCIQGPALLYFHRSGQFRLGGGTGTAQLGSAIGPAQGTNPTFDSFFTSAGAQVPVPNLIIFHNPGTGAGQALKISRNSPGPCDDVILAGDPPCNQDAFYYVDAQDRLTSGSTALGAGSARRVPAEIQGTGCECLGFDNPAQQLGTGTAGTARCNEFLRGGRIDYVFLRDDQNPPFPQLVWRVVDSTGALVHDFDERAGLGP